MREKSSLDNLISALSRNGSALVKSTKNNCWLLFTEPSEVILADTTKSLPDFFSRVKKNVLSGYYCCASISYDASPCFDKKLEAHFDKSFPCAWAAFYSEPIGSLKISDLPHAIESKIEIRTELSKEEYIKRIRRIKNYIRNGHTYQVNFTFRISTDLQDEAEFFFLNLMKYQQPEFASYINAGAFKILSFSPELFLMKKNNTLISMPMKGTIKRAPDTDTDAKFAKQLASDEKNRAENIMITDMVRNDLGKICKAGSVKTKEIFRIITTPTVHQMISIVEGKIKNNISLFDIFRALFPPASITGAPKCRTMQIIKEFEKSPRSFYTGAIGLITPKQDFLFNVAIRTATLKNKKLIAGIGGGIVADSDPSEEWNEALLKAEFLNAHSTDFEIFETMLYQKKYGYKWLDDHLDRLEKSQRYFLRPFNKERIKGVLLRISQKLPAIARVKISLDERGKYKISWSKLDFVGWGKKEILITISNIKTNSKDRFFYHKTTQRKIYDEEFHRAQELGFDEIIFMNERNEITEGSRSNIFILTDRGWITPPISCGLLAGIWRKNMIRKLKASELVITFRNLSEAKKILIGNSLRLSAEGKLRKN